MASDNYNTCSSTYISTNGVSYQRVCGRARGYQKGYTLAFYGTGSYYSKKIDEDYVSGLSITYGSNTRHHIWTYASGFSEKHNSPNNCPCSFTGGYNSSFAGSNYYCETGLVNHPDSGNAYHFNDMLWDGAGCTEGTCCDDTTQPWFYRQLKQTTEDDIEARICAHGPFRSRSTLIDQLELYIQ